MGIWSIGKRPTNTVDGILGMQNVHVNCKNIISSNNEIIS